MLQIKVSKSGFFQIAKSITGDSYDKVYKDIIAFMKELEKKEDSKELKKAIEYLESSEGNFTHLEKSYTGEWIEKAGYGVGTIRIWKGKKYKKISSSPTRWVRVFDKNDRGAKNAMTRLIHQAEKYKDDPEGMMKLLLENKQRFYDEDSKRYLDIVDRLNAFVDNSSSKTPAVSENSEEKFKEEVNSWKAPSKIEDLVNGGNFKAEFKGNTMKVTGLVDGSLKKLYKNITPFSKMQPSMKMKLHKMEQEGKISAKDRAFIFESNGKFYLLKKGEGLQSVGNHYYSNTDSIISLSDDKKGPLDKVLEENTKDMAESLGNSVDEDFGKNKEPETEENVYWIMDSKGNRLTNIDAKKRIVNNLNKIDEIKTQMDSMDNKADTVHAGLDIRKLEYDNITLMDYLNKDDRKEMESEAEKHQNRSGAYEYQEPAQKKTTKATPGYKASESVQIDDKPPIATNTKSGENEVTMPFSKELNEEIKTLKNCVEPEYSNRKFMQYVYYDNGKLIATDGRRMKIVKVGELDGIANGSFVDIDSDKSGIKIKKVEVDGQFPQYSRVIPNDLHQKVTLNNAAIKEKIKEMQKDGAINKKRENIVQLEFKDGSVFIDDTLVGSAKDLKLKTGGWREEKKDTNFINVNADYFMNALTGGESILMLSDNNARPMGISTDSTVNIVMPMNNTTEKLDYSEGRKKKAEENEAKEKVKQHARKEMDEYIENLNSEMNDEKYDRLKNSVITADKQTLQTAYEAYRKAETSYKNSSSSRIYDNRYGFKLLATAQKYPDFISIFKDAAQKQGIEVKKSLFDFMDPFILDDLEIEDTEEDVPNYDATTPELFNSVSSKVKNALDEYFFGC